jgi:hypothetical protein
MTNADPQTLFTMTTHTLSRQELYDLLWSHTTQTLHERFGFSESYVHHLRELHNLPLRRNEQGERPPLPDAPLPEGINVPIIVHEITRTQIAIPKVQMENLERHPITRRIAALYKNARVNDQGIVFVKNEYYLVQILQVSHAQMEWSLSILDAIFHACDQHGYDITGPEDKDESEIRVAASGESVGFYLAEGIKRVQHRLTEKEIEAKKRGMWSSRQQWDYVPTEQLRLHTYNLANVSHVQRNWTIGNNRYAERAIGKFIATVGSAHVLRNFVTLQAAEEEKVIALLRPRWDEQQRQRELQEREELLRRWDHQYKAGLIQRKSQDWLNFSVLRNFATELKERVGRTDLGPRQQDASEMVEWVRKYLAAIDPLADLGKFIKTFKG